MTPLNQQLEDKKKGCGKTIFSGKQEIGTINICQKGLLCNQCKAEIAILEQAISEIKNIQSQQNTNTTSTNSTWKLCEGELEHFKSKDNDPNNDKQRTEVETGSADTPQDEICLTPEDNISNLVVSNSKMMRIEIIPKDKKDGTTYFDLEINGKKKIKDTGLVNVCNHLIRNFLKYCKEKEK